MACYRLIFHNTEAFEVLVESEPVHGDYPSSLCVALIYRVTNGVRETEPLRRVAGGPIQVLAVNEHTALDIVTEVLKEVTGSRLATISDCGPDPFSPPIAGFA